MGDTQKETRADDPLEALRHNDRVRFALEVVERIEQAAAVSAERGIFGVVQLALGPLGAVELRVFARPSLSDGEREK